MGFKQGGLERGHGGVEDDGWLGTRGTWIDSRYASSLMDKQDTCAVRLQKLLGFWPLGNLFLSSSLEENI